MINSDTVFKKQNDPLFTLVKALTKSEKRQFNLYVGRLEGNAEAKFYTLFKILNKQKAYDEKAILDQKIVSKSQLSNLKANLYKQILISLRLNPVHKNIRIQIREQLDFATVLYQKGLYSQSLKLLAKAKSMALEAEEKNMAFEIVELEKLIESQHITRSIDSRVDELTVEAKILSQQNVITSKLSNLSLQLYGVLLKTGYARNESELEKINAYFEDKLPKYDFKTLGFREKLWLYKAHLWRSFLTHDFLSSYKYAQKCVEIFKLHPEQITIHPVFYLKSKHYLFEALFFIKKHKAFTEELTLFKTEIEEERIPKNSNTELLMYQYLYINQLNYHFLEGTFKEGEYLVEHINKYINDYINHLDRHHIVVLYYKIACLYFGMGNNKACITYLNRIIQSKHMGVAEDLQCFARLLNVIAHYECGLDDNFEKQLKDTYKFLLKMENLQLVQREIIGFIRRLDDVYPHQLKFEFRKIHQKLKKLEHHPFEKRAFLYLDFLSWLECKIENIPVAEVIQRKRKLRKE